MNKWTYNNKRFITVDGETYIHADDHYDEIKKVIEIFNKPTSDCCQAKVLGENDGEGICTKCGEHCTI